MPTIQKLVESSNICNLLDDEKVREIGLNAQEGYVNDKASRMQWEERMAQANKLALQVASQKTFPWQGASNVKFPLVTVAAMQYAARAYPALVPGDDLVKVKVYPHQNDDWQRENLAARISTHMSWQNLEQMPEWEENHDKLLLVQAISGCPLIKRTFDPVAGRQKDKLVLPDNFVINYYCTDIQGAPRYTETYYLWPNDIYQRELDGRFTKDVPVTPTEPLESSDQLTEAKDERQGIRRGSSSGEDEGTKPFFTGEQSCWLDLDEDGYAEPYLVTFNIDSGRVHRICARYLPSGVKNKRGAVLGSPEWAEEPTVYAIDPVAIYTKYPFIPSPDGGFYDLGFGALLGPINESVNTSLNMMFDAGTMATLGGGFLGRGFKGKGGPFTFQPNEWKPVDAPGDDLRKNIMPLPVRDPPAILFQLLGFLVNYAERIASANDMQVGENIGQNTPAETARTMNENGQRVYSAIYKRTWRSMRNEFRIQADLNALFLDTEADYERTKALATAADYRAMGVFVRPAADPYVVSDSQKIQQAQLVVANSMQMPGHNRYQSLLRLYRVMKVPDIEQIMPAPMQQGPNGQMVPAKDFPPPGPDPKMLEVQIKEKAQQLKELEFQAGQRELQIKLQIDIATAQAKIADLQADAVLKTSQAKSAEADPAIKLIYAEIELQGQHKQHLQSMLDILTKNLGAKKDGESTGNDGNGVARMAAASAYASVPQSVAGLGSGNPTGMVQ